MESLTFDPQVTFYASPEALRNPLLHPSLKDGLLRPITSGDLLILGVLKPETLMLAGSLHQFQPDAPRGADDEHMFHEGRSPVFSRRTASATNNKLPRACKACCSPGRAPSRPSWADTATRPSRNQYA